MTAEHNWIKRKNDTWTFCKVCNVVKRKDGKNKPCKGPVKISLR